MANSYFRFKHFVVEQQRAAMKVGTDGVLLGAWCRVDGSTRRMLDVGTGTGLLALMLAQRCCGLAEEVDVDETLIEAAAFVIDAIEIDEMSVSQAVENVEASPWRDRIRIINVSLQSFGAARVSVSDTATGYYDHIVSNPPYFNNSLLSPDKGRTQARHTCDLSYEELAVGVDRLLSCDGFVSLIIPFAESVELIDVFCGHGFSLSRRTDVFPNDSKPAKRVLLEFVRAGSFVGCELHATSLVIETEHRHNYTDDYKTLTSDFYL